MKDIKNHRKRIKLENTKKILGTLATVPNGLRFEELLETVGFSRSTLTRHLHKLLQEKSIQKSSRRFGSYTITQTGLEKLRELHNLAIKTTSLKTTTSALGWTFHQNTPKISASGTVSIEVTTGAQVPDQVENPLSIETDYYIFRIPKSTVEVCERGWLLLGWTKKSHQDDSDDDSEHTTPEKE